MERLQSLSFLVLPCMVMIGYIIGDSLFMILMSIQLSAAISMEILFGHLSSFYWLLKIVCPLLVSFAWIFKHYKIAITIKNSTYIALITCILVLMLNGLNMGFTRYLYETLSMGPYMILSMKITPMLNVLLKPIGLPLLFWILLSVKLPLTCQKEALTFSHSITLFLLLCAVGAILYGAFALFVHFYLTLDHIKFVLLIMASCFIYDRLQYSSSYNAKRMTGVQFLIVTIALVLSSIVSIGMTEYIVKNYGAKEMASLIIFIVIAGLAMIISTQVLMRKLCYEMTPMK